MRSQSVKLIISPLRRAAASRSPRSPETVPAAGYHALQADAIARARSGDKGCQRLLIDAAEILARCVATACNVLNPQAIILAGSLLPADDLLTKPLREFPGAPLTDPIGSQ